MNTPNPKTKTPHPPRRNPVIALILAALLLGLLATLVIVGLAIAGIFPAA